MNDQFEFYVAGVQYHDLKTCIDKVEVGEQLFMVPEPTNKYDPNAVQIKKFDVDKGDIMLGFVPGKMSAAVSAFIETGTDPVCLVTEVTPSAKPWQQLKVVVKENESNG